MSDRVPKMCGNELEKDGAAWMAGNEILPIGSLFGERGQKGSEAAPLAGRVFVVREHSYESPKPKMALAALKVTIFSILTMLWYMCLEPSH